MNQHQRIAYRSPCYYAQETERLDFYWPIVGRGGRRISLGLTANIGPE